jgi:hypothetical protein
MHRDLFLAGMKQSILWTGFCASFAAKPIAHVTATAKLIDTSVKVNKLSHPQTHMSSTRPRLYV